MSFKYLYMQHFINYKENTNNARLFSMRKYLKIHHTKSLEEETII